MPHRNSEEMTLSVTNPNIANNKFLNEQMECEQNTITYTSNPIYESFTGSHAFGGQILTTRAVEAKQDEKYSSVNLTRNADTLHAYLDGSVQNSPFPIHYTDMDGISNEHDAAKNMYDTLSPHFETSTTSHQSVQTARTGVRDFQDNCCNAAEDLQAAAKNVTLSVPKPLPSYEMCAEILNAKPHETDV